MTKKKDSTESGFQGNQMGDGLGAKNHGEEIRQPYMLKNKILLFLKKHGELTFGQIAEMTGMEDKTSNLSYHLTQLKNGGLIDKEVRAPLRKTFWKYTALVPNVIESKILKILEENLGNSQGVASSEIVEKIMLDWYDPKGKQSQEGSRIETDVLHAISELVKRGKVEETSYGMATDKDGNPVDYFGIPFWQLPDNVCHHCRKKFGPDNLIISQTFVDPGDEIIDMPIHATCQSSMLHDRFNHTPVCCDYCGITLNPKDLDSFLDSSVIEGDPEEPHTKPNTLLESGLAELFGKDPYSKIFPYIRNSQHFLDMTSQLYGFGEQFTPGRFIKYVRKNGKKYHPYCAEQVEKKKR